jgi:chromosome partitioning protein
VQRWQWTSTAGQPVRFFDVTHAQPTINGMLAGLATADAIHEDLIPANLNLAEAELMLGGKLGRELTLRRALDKAPD